MLDNSNYYKDLNGSLNSDRFVNAFHALLVDVHTDILLHDTTREDLPSRVFPPTLPVDNVCNPDADLASVAFDFDTCSESSECSNLVHIEWAK